MEEVFEEVPEPVAQSDEEKGYSEEILENTTTEAYRIDELIDSRSKRTNNANDGDIEENKANTQKEADSSRSISLSNDDINENEVNEVESVGESNSESNVGDPVTLDDC